MFIMNYEARWVRKTKEERRLQLYFIDLEKAFDTVIRDILQLESNKFLAKFRIIANLKFSH